LFLVKLELEFGIHALTSIPVLMFSKTNTLQLKEMVWLFLLRKYWICFVFFRKRYNSKTVKVVFLMLGDDEPWLRTNFEGLEDAAFPQREAASTELGKIRQDI
jgi:hypothetical protein